MSDMTTIKAEDIKAARERRQMTQADLAAELKVSLRTVGNWERGDSVPRSRMGALVDALGLEQPTEYQWSQQQIRARVGQLAKQRREELGISRETMADRSGLKSPQTIQNFEFARSMPHTSTLSNFEKALEWRIGSIDEALESGRRASDLTMEDFDKFDRDDLRPLESFTTEEILYEAIRRLSEFRGALGPLPEVAAKYMYGLAANNDPSHLEREAEGK